MIQAGNSKARLALLSFFEAASIACAKRTRQNKAMPEKITSFVVLIAKIAFTGKAAKKYQCQDPFHSFPSPLRIPCLSCPPPICRSIFFFMSATCCSHISKSCRFFCTIADRINPAKNDTMAANTANPHTINVGKSGTCPVCI